MSTVYAVGKSSFGALRGLTQYVATAAIAAQVLSLIEESRAAFAGGAVLSVNEGIRSRPRQDLLWQAWLDYRYHGGPWAALAAQPYGSTHDASRGSALDFGVTNADGTNRALTMSEHAWVVARGKLRGIAWTGGDPSFMSPAELWHFNGGWMPAVLPPLDLNTPIAQKEIDMPTIVRATQGGIVPKGTKLMFAPGFVHSVAAVTVRAAGLDESDITPVSDDNLRVIYRDHGLDVASLKKSGGLLAYSTADSAHQQTSRRLREVFRKLGIGWK